VRALRLTVKQRPRPIAQTAQPGSPTPSPGPSGTWQDRVSEAKAREVAFGVAQPGCGPRREHTGEHLCWHCQLKQRWYAPAVGGAVVRCGEVLGPPIGLSPSQPRGDRKLASTPLS
jgi:hypothetical protein